MTAKPKFYPRCPTCEMLVDMADGGKSMPFCSERCKLIDLGRWLNEEHTLPCESEEDAEESVEQGESSVRLPPGWHDA